MEDLGSGALVDLARYGLPHEPVVAERVQRGADLVTFSADKLLGGPQAGIVVGDAALIERLRQNPLARALRCDKLTLAALEATLRLYRTAPDLAAALPTLRWLTRPLAEMETVGAAAVALLQRALGPEYAVVLVDSEAADRQRGAADRDAAQQGDLDHPSDHRAARRSPRASAPASRRSSGGCSDDQFLLDLRCVTHAPDLVPRKGSEGPTSSTPARAQAAYREP